MFRLACLTSCVGLATVAGIAQASPFNTHWGISVNDDGRLVTEGWQGGVGYLGESRVFAFESQELAGQQFFDIGTNSVGGTFATPGQIGFNYRSAVGLWNGDGFDDAGVDMTFQFGTLSATSGMGFVPGFGTAVRDETTHPSSPGQWGRHHTHQDVFLSPGASDGIYLMEFELWYLPGNGNPVTYADSRPFWVLFSQNSSPSEVDVAISYVQDVIVPAPGSLAVLGLGALALRRRR